MGGIYGNSQEDRHFEAMLNKHLASQEECPKCANCDHEEVEETERHDFVSASGTTASFLWSGSCADCQATMKGRGNHEGDDVEWEVDHCTHADDAKEAALNDEYDRYRDDELVE